MNFRNPFLFLCVIFCSSFAETPTNTKNPSGATTALANQTPATPMSTQEQALKALQETMNAIKDQTNEICHEREQIIKYVKDCNIISNDDILNYLFDHAPLVLQEYTAIINAFFEQNKKGNKGIPWNLLPRKLLLVGPPGVGKTTLAYAITKKLNRKICAISMPLLSNEYRNSEIANLTRMLDGLIAVKEPVVIILDEINIMANRKEQSMGGEDISNASALWLLLDRCARNLNILIIATANDITKLPVQLKDRFEGNVIEIPKATKEDRFYVLNYYLSQAPHDCKTSYIQSLAKKTEDFSPRQLEALVKIAQQQRFINFGTIEGLQDYDLEAAYKRFLISSELLQSKPGRIARLKEWIKENAVVIQATASSVSLGSIFLGALAYVLLGKNKNSNFTSALPKGRP